MAVYDRLETALLVISVPANTLSTTVQHVTGLSDMASDLEMMRAENARLKQWYDRARQLEAENRSLRSLVKLADLPRMQFVTARVIGESGNGFAQSIIVDAGSNQGVTPNMVAMTGDGVVGRVVAFSKKTTQILLINDVNARLPVVIENSRHRGVLAGDNTAQPQLVYLPDDAAVSVGERVLTSGHGGTFAPGLAVGTISAVTTKDIRIQPTVDLRRLDIIQLIDFGQKDPFQEQQQEAQQEPQHDKAVQP
jgi:rod shape-determining protein MreC